MKADESFCKSLGTKITVIAKAESILYADI
jgi:hypothetical protein